MIRQRLFSPAARLTFTLLIGLLFTADLNAQTVTGTLRGRVLNEASAPVASANVSARNIANGVTRNTMSNPNGVYVLAGLQPGTYEVAVNMVGYASSAQTVRVLIGQSLALDLQLRTQAIELGAVSAVATRIIETKTSEVATNVSPEQMERLPQMDRNFLNFAALAPGITISRDETNKTITAGGLPSSKINVFVDGASFKNDMLEGGLHGQDASRGNAFPQIALQEFRVLTQNFKAEYQRAASAVITAVTKSGTNEFAVDGFVLGQNKGLVERNPGSVELCDAGQEGFCAKPEFERLQFGLSAGGPIIRDKAHFFLAYESNLQNRQEIVTVGDTAFADAMLASGRTAASYEGEFDQPFRSHLAIAKLSYIPGTNQTLDLSWNGRFESDKRGFGGTTSFEAAQDIAIQTNVLTLQYGLSRGNWLNQVNVSGQRASWNPKGQNESGDLAFNYDGVIRIGAYDTEQKFQQDRIAIRNDLTRFNVSWNGSHVFKGGANVDFLNYELEKRFNGNPLFVFQRSEGFDAPVRAHYGMGDPGMSENNVQFGAYIQDDWDVNRNLQLNLGVRWDAETNQFNNNWVTPDSIRTRFAGLGYENRFTDGDERPMFLGAFQPRVGFSYDVKADARTVVHGGWGLYYDREVWNHMIDERFRLQWATRNFNFTTTGEAGEIPWDDSYLSRAGLEGIIASAAPNGPTSEVFLLDNDTKPPRSQQFSFGLRQVVGRNIVLGAAYRGVRGSHLMSWYCGVPHPDHGYCEGGRQTLGLANDPVLSTDEGESRYNAFDLTAGKTYTESSRWGITLAYTLADGEKKGADFFTLEFPLGDTINGTVINSPSDWEMVKSNIEKHRVTVSGIVGLPLDIVASTFVQWGSGVRFSARDQMVGWGPGREVVDFNSETGDSFQQVDLRLEKRFNLPGQGRVGLIVEGVNVFNHANYRGYDELQRNDAGIENPNFGRPHFGSADNGRRIQLGLNFNSK